MTFMPTGKPKTAHPPIGGKRKSATRPRAQLGLALCALLVCALPLNALADYFVLGGGGGGGGSNLTAGGGGGAGGHVGTYDPYGGGGAGGSGGGLGGYGGVPGASGSGGVGGAGGGGSGGGGAGGSGGDGILPGSNGEDSGAGMAAGGLAGLGGGGGGGGGGAFSAEGSPSGSVAVRGGAGGANGSAYAGGGGGEARLGPSTLSVAGDLTITGGGSGSILPTGDGGNAGVRVANNADITGTLAITSGLNPVSATGGSAGFECGGALSVPTIVAIVRADSADVVFNVHTLDCGSQSTAITADATTAGNFQIGTASVGPGRTLSATFPNNGAMEITTLALTGAGANVNLPAKAAVANLSLDITVPLTSGGVAYSVGQLTLPAGFGLSLGHLNNIDLQPGESATLIQTASPTIGTPGSSTVIGVKGATYSVSTTGSSLVITCLTRPVSSLPRTGDSFPLFGLQALALGLLALAVWQAPHALGRKRG